GGEALWIFGLLRGRELLVAEPFADLALSEGRRACGRGRRQRKHLALAVNVHLRGREGDPADRADAARTVEELWWGVYLEGTDREEEANASRALTRGRCSGFGRGDASIGW